MDYKKFYEDISIHVEMMVTPEMRMHACADPVHHDLTFQVFRLLSGYGEALEELKKLRPANIQQQLQPDILHFHHSAFSPNAKANKSKGQSTL